VSSHLLLRTQPLSQQVADAIRQMILIGTLTPGEELRLDDLAESLEVSTMPVREAMLRLSHDGLVEAHPNRSFRVARFSRDDVADILRTHAFLAGERTARAAVRAQPSLDVELRAIADRWDAAEGSALNELNQQFHRRINTAAQAQTLVLLLRTATRFIPQHFCSMIPEWREVARRGHADLATAIGSRDAAAAQATAREHVMDVGHLLMAHFSDRGYWLTPRPV
jgi:DNA-binding GntR family transcriptional regulator